MTQEKICKILKLGFGGVGVAKEEGKVYFVPFSAPGDLVKIKIEKEKKRFAFGKVVQIISPSLLRIHPPCPYFGRCGGCQLQHLHRGDQREFKQSIVKEAFHKYAHLEVDFPLANLKEGDLEYRYRDHITLHFKDDVLGFYSCDEDPQLIEIRDCLLFKQEISQLTPLLKKTLIEMKIQVAHIKLIATSKGLIVAIRTKRQWKLKPDSSSLLLSLQRSGNLYSIGITDGEGAQFETENFSIEFATNRSKMQISPWSFLQNQGDLAMRAYEEMQSWLLDKKVKNILDLFSGSGIQTLSLSPSFSSIIAIENNPFAVKSALANAERNQINNVRFIEGNAEDFDKLLDLSNREEMSKIDAVILNPPKGGCDEKLLDKIAIYKIREIVYMSCFPSTLARDVQILSKAGYKLQNGKIFDFFPQTTHVETIVHLSSEP